MAAWLGAHGTTVPEAVCIALQQHSALCEALEGSEQRLRAVLVQMRRALGVSPSSERRKSRDPLGPVSGGDGKRALSDIGKLKLNRDRLDRLSKWHGRLQRKQRRKVQKIDKKLKELPVDEIPLSAEEEAELDREHEASMQRYRLGDGADPVLQPADEKLMTGGQVKTSEEEVYLPAPTPTEPDAKVVETITEERVRHDLTLVVGRMTAQVEKKVVRYPNGDRTVLSASTLELGPPRFGVTWRFLTNVAVLVVQYAMPMNRLGALLSTNEKRFSAAALSRMLRYTAEHVVPIYLNFFEALADTPFVAGDDTNTRVLEVQRFLRQTDGAAAPPWAPYRTPAAAAKSIAEPKGDTLEARLSRELGFEFERRSGDGKKRGFHTTMLSGRTEADEPRSVVVFYRSHLGGLGNLLERMLRLRDGREKSLVVLSDLSTVNLVSDPVLLARFAIQYAGCSSHARRPFALYEHEDPDACGYMLHMFKGLAIHEHGLDLWGRNPQNVAAIRGVDSRRMWLEIKEQAERMTEYWSPQTKLGEAARYIIRHFDKLTLYLDDVRLPPTNNHSERMLRTEKLIESGSMFRATIRGRFVLDILRTLLQTAVAAQVPLQEYLMDLLRTPAECIQENPQRYTPLAWRRRNVDAASSSPGDLDEAGSLD